VGKEERKKFQREILVWYQGHKRDFLPWRVTEKRRVSPYRIFVSEIMLQQTGVTRVREFFPKFISRFPAIQCLDHASLREILGIWQGLGYNRRALHLKRAAAIIVRRYKGRIPSDVSDLKKLPGVGPYTAGAIACFAYNQAVAFLDTNIRKVLLFHFFPGRKKISDGELLRIAEKVLFRENPRLWHYALMDYGSLMLRGVAGLAGRSAAYRKQSRFEGSRRYWRAAIIRRLSSAPLLPIVALADGIPPVLREQVFSSLIADGLVEKTREGYYRIAQE
jgi:A/G-specific adenine glycosylase